MSTSTTTSDRRGRTRPASAPEPEPGTPDPMYATGRSEASDRSTDSAMPLRGTSDDPLDAQPDEAELETNPRRLSLRQKSASIAASPLAARMPRVHWNHGPLPR